LCKEKDRGGFHHSKPAVSPAAQDQDAQAARAETNKQRAAGPV